MRVALCDDHGIVRSGLRRILDAEDDLEVVGEAGSIREAVALAGAERPDVCLAKPFRDLAAIEEAVAQALESVTGETALTGLRDRLTQVMSDTMSPIRKKRE